MIHTTTAPQQPLEAVQYFPKYVYPQSCPPTTLSEPGKRWCSREHRIWRNSLKNNSNNQMKYLVLILRRNFPFSPNTSEQQENLKMRGQLHLHTRTQHKPSVLIHTSGSISLVSVFWASYTNSHETTAGNLAINRARAWLLNISLLHPSAHTPSTLVKHRVSSWNDGVYFILD